MKRNMHIERKKAGSAPIYHNSILQNYNNENMCKWCSRSNDNCKVSAVIIRRISQDHKIKILVTECPYFVEKTQEEPKIKTKTDVYACGTCGNTIKEGISICPFCGFERNISQEEEKDE
ncbi:hypothetical protein M0R01_03905 [bacterium]|nr:hypothetical protein [bacterium]